MFITYKPKSELEKFGAKIFNLLVENFPLTFYVGGMVRDLLLNITVRDVDIATSANPKQVMAILQSHQINFDPQYQKLGIVAIQFRDINFSVTTFRKDHYINGRYPKVTFKANIKQDALRRDFTINALYLSPKNGKILDFHQGLKDLKSKSLKFIGNPDKRIKEDPLRIIRALRFEQTLNFRLEKNTKRAIKNNILLVKMLTNSKINKELAKIKNLNQRKFIRGELVKQNLIDTK